MGVHTVKAPELRAFLKQVRWETYAVDSEDGKQLLYSNHRRFKVMQGSGVLYEGDSLSLAVTRYNTAPRLRF